MVWMNRNLSMDQKRITESSIKNVCSTFHFSPQKIKVWLVWIFIMWFFVCPIQSENINIFLHIQRLKFINSGISWSILHPQNQGWHLHQLVHLDLVCWPPGPNAEDPPPIAPLPNEKWSFNIDYHTRLKWQTNSNQRTIFPSFWKFATSKFDLQQIIFIHLEKKLNFIILTLNILLIFTSCKLWGFKSFAVDSILLHDVLTLKSRTNNTQAQNSNL